ncbi:thioredoxin-like protein [Obelidium mucronatum]|nr:thioredoxin-like protein [Obelidium mucronatum]
MFRVAIRKFSSTASTPSSKLLGTVVERGDLDFKATLIEAGNSPVLVDFYADWCGPCRMLAPILTKAVSQPNSQTFLVKVNVDEAVKTAGEYRIASLPTVGLFKDGKLVDQFVGVRDEKFVKAFIEKHV